MFRPLAIEARYRTAWLTTCMPPASTPDRSSTFLMYALERPTIIIFGVPTLSLNTKMRTCAACSAQECGQWCTCPAIAARLRPARMADLALIPQRPRPPPHAAGAEVQALRESYKQAPSPSPLPGLHILFITPRRTIFPQCAQRAAWGEPHSPATVLKSGAGGRGAKEAS